MTSTGAATVRRSGLVLFVALVLSYTGCIEGTCDWYGCVDLGEGFCIWYEG